MALSHWYAGVLGACGLLLVGCQSSDFDLQLEQEAEGVTLLQLSSEGGFVLPAIPDDNPLTDAKITLGRYLFYDTRLSGNQTQSCESCHFQELAFTDGKVVPTGSTGDDLVRNSQTLTNVAYNGTYTWWNSIFTSIELQLAIPLTGDTPEELGINDANLTEVLDRFRNDEDYQTLFTDAFPSESDPFTLTNITYALASFTRTMVSDRSPYDNNELSDSARRGETLFFSEELECFHCHNGFNFSSSTITTNTRFPERPFFNTGLYNIDNQGSYPEDNTGKYQVTGDWNDMGAFRPPTLRNIELTAPYMHDGSMETLEEVLEFYADGGRNITSGEYSGDGRDNPYKSSFVSGFDLSDDDKTDLINFLHSLTDQEFISDERFSNPFE
ncbi:methanobactin export MATE transporter MbnM [Oceanobacter sp. 4_MG-2023]|uniref:methanobactin export MATE transporter MbnM n=1 Tax=Oceanobacter sp. 4_MG-2023 TaxID=3062623 RepID=UPI0027348729|nr:methanobactin export MATE transporter MbnM [Oceanobacter sp. 4_MG-2023]MDP2548004.1 di-heme enzyme [Oceanobacter sp. 4_MG-2023]